MLSKTLNDLPTKVCSDKARARRVKLVRVLTAALERLLTIYAGMLTVIKYLHLRKTPEKFGKINTLNGTPKTSQCV